MKKISYWAKAHKWSARFIIVVSFLLLNGIGIVTGILLSQLDINVPVIVMVAFFTVFLIAWFAYPSKDMKGKKINPTAFYIKQKICDFALAASAFCMVVYLGNHPDRLFQFYPSLNATVTSEPSLPTDSIKREYKSVTAFATSLKNENGNNLKWKERKKLLKEQIKGIKMANDLSSGEKTLLIILSVLVALGLLYLVAALSCSISCGGADALAVIVAIGGTALVIYLLVIVIRSINGKKKKKKQTVEKSTTGS